LLFEEAIIKFRGFISRHIVPIFTHAGDLIVH